MPAVGFKPTISAGERPQTYALDRAVNGTGVSLSNAEVKNQWRYTSVQPIRFQWCGQRQLYF